MALKRQADIQSYWSLAKIGPIYIPAKLKQKHGIFRFIVLLQRYISAKRNNKSEFYCYTHDQIIILKKWNTLQKKKVNVSKSLHMQ